MPTSLLWTQLMKQLNAIMTIAHRDILKLFRDRARLISSLVFPFVFVAILGPSFQAGFGNSVGYNLALFTFTGVYAQTLFQSAAFGLISLIEDRDNDFSQEIFVSPISRYSIIIGKILGEALVAMTQGIGILLFGVIIAVVSGIKISPVQLLGMIPMGIIVCLFGGSLCIILLANVARLHDAEEIFPLV